MESKNLDRLIKKFLAFELMKKDRAMVLRILLALVKYKQHIHLLRQKKIFFIF